MPIGVWASWKLQEVHLFSWNWSCDFSWFLPPNARRDIFTKVTCTCPIHPHNNQRWSSKVGHHEAVHDSAEWAFMCTVVLSWTSQNVVENVFFSCRRAVRDETRGNPGAWWAKEDNDCCCTLHSVSDFLVIISRIELLFLGENHSELLYMFQMKGKANPPPKKLTIPDICLCKNNWTLIPRCRCSCYKNQNLTQHLPMHLFLREKLLKIHHSPVRKLGAWQP